jgi:hypothetical protein
MERQEEIEEKAVGVTLVYGRNSCVSWRIAGQKSGIM